MNDTEVRSFVIDNPQHTKEVFDAVQSIISVSQDQDYFTVNDRVFIAIVSEGVFKYTHELRKYYQLQIKSLMGLVN